MIGATLFSGGRGVEALLTDAIDFRLSVEYDPQIAAVGAQLGGETIVSKVEDVDYSTWPALDYLHASPVCKEYSQAKSGGAEGESDLSSAAAVVRCLEATRPRVFTLENVGAYQHGQAYRRICTWLNHNGYMWHAEVLNSADYSVPQTRRRLILRAVRDALLPPLPAPEAWVGWYAAIEDLIPTLPPSQFAAWQLERLPEELTRSVLVESKNANQQFGDGMRFVHEPAPTIVTDHKESHRPTAFIVAQGAFGDNQVISECAEPVFTVTANSNQSNVKAWFVNEDSKMGIVDADTPAPTQVSSARARSARALLVGGGNTNITIVDSKAREELDPAFTVTHASVRDRAWLSAGRVVKMTPRALARFQSLPDWYVLPTKASLACTVIGNMVPSLLMSKIVRPLL